MSEGVQAILKKLQFIIDLPAKLQKFYEEKEYAEAVR